jgi:hypothetical protein
MTDELERERKALAAEIEHLRLARDEMVAKGKEEDGEAEQLRKVRVERRRVNAGRKRIAEAAKDPDLELNSAVALALERQRIADHTAEQDAHLKVIDGSIEKSALAIEDLGRQFAAAAGQRSRELAVAEALATAFEDQQKEFKEQREGGITTKRLYISVIAIILPMLLTLLVVVFKG